MNIYNNILVYLYKKLNIVRKIYNQAFLNLRAASSNISFSLQKANLTKFSP